MTLLKNNSSLVRSQKVETVLKARGRSTQHLGTTGFHVPIISSSKVRFGQQRRGRKQLSLAVSLAHQAWPSMKAAVAMEASGRGEKQGNGERGFTEGWALGLIVSWTLWVSLSSLLALGPPGSRHPKEALLFLTSNTSSNLENKEMQSVQKS